VRLKGIIRDVGIEYAELPKPNDISGLIEAYGGGYRIVVNSNHSIIVADLRQPTSRGIMTRPIAANAWAATPLTRKFVDASKRLAATILMPSMFLDRLRTERIFRSRNGKAIASI
jgi:hypothetical protein